MRFRFMSFLFMYGSFLFWEGGFGLHLHCIGVLPGWDGEPGGSIHWEGMQNGYMGF